MSADHPAAQRLSIGLLHPRAKFEQSAFIGLVDHADVTWLDPTRDLEAQAAGKAFDVVIIKLTDWLHHGPVSGGSRAVMSDSDEVILGRVSAFLSRRPKTRVVDPVEHTLVLSDRQLLAERLRSLELPDNVALAPYVVLEARPVEPPADVSLPVLIKPLEACGSKISHSLVVVRDWQALQGVDEVYFPAIAETMIEHSLLAKANVVMCRRSGPDVCITLYNDVMPGGDVSPFDSQAHTKGMTLADGSQLTDADREAIISTCGVVSKGLGLTVLGLDFVKETRTGKLHLIDVNFFPACSRGRKRDMDLLRACLEYE